ncbi:MAG: phosphoribosylamine--glycine ligase, partial [Planctomycetes bacterium]|nr:phosphoribosylamine--glycine ligase [Planctomycetota bacterium]
REGRRYVGVLYAGLMMTKSGPKVVEFNCRFGDPEIQPLVMRLDTDLVDLLEAVTDRRLDEIDIKWKDAAAVCVVMASKGYPGKYEKGLPINGLQAVAQLDDVEVFHAGTAQKSGKIVTNGGRVLGVTALGADIPTAIERAYEATRMLSFDGSHYRTDIGQKAVAHIAR